MAKPRRANHITHNAATPELTVIASRGLAVRAVAYRRHRAEALPIEHTTMRLADL